MALLGARVAARERAARDSRSPTRRATPRRGARCAPARRRAPRRSGGAPPRSSMRRSQNGSSATQKRSASCGSRASSVPSAARRFAASRSSCGESRSRSASASAQRACRRASAARLAGLGEPLARVQAHGLEQAIARVRARPRPRLTSDFSTSRAEHVGALRDGRARRRRRPPRPRRARSRRRRRPGAAAASARRGSSRSWLHCSVAAQRLLPRRRRAAAGAQQPEAVVQPLGERGRAERAEPPGGQLERERQAVEPEADARDVHRVLVVEREARHRPPPRARRTGAPPRSGAARPAAWQLLRVGDRERRHAEHDLAADAQRLAARREHGQPGRRPEQRVDERRARARAGARSCRARAAACAARGTRPAASDDVLSRQRAHVERGRDGVGRRAADRTLPRARRARRRPAYDSSTPRASSSASRVLPAPPVPASVSRRVCPSSARSSPSSRPRPTNELASAGSVRAASSPGSSAASSCAELCGAAPRAPRAASRAQSS